MTLLIACCFAFMNKPGHKSERMACLMGSRQLRVSDYCRVRSIKSCLSIIRKGNDKTYPSAQEFPLKRAVRGISVPVRSCSNSLWRPRRLATLKWQFERCVSTTDLPTAAWQRCRERDQLPLSPLCHSRHHRRDAC